MVDRPGSREERRVTADVLRVVKWDTRQSYRGDQNTTQKWIKVWRDVNVNPKWQSLTDSQRGQLVMVWVLASERKGEIRAPGGQLEAFVARYCGMTDPLDLSVFEALGLVEIDRCATVPTTAVQRSPRPLCNGHSPARTAREEEIRGDQIREEEIRSENLAAAEYAHVREDGWPAAPPPTSRSEGPNTAPTRKQLDAIASYAEYLDHVPKAPRTKAEASRLIDELKIETEHQRARRLENARESGRLAGKVDGRHQQATDATQEMVERIQGRR